ncbi:hypothetical protein [Alienimonas californiensis]|uniref:Uncharacterized protein n=1 Tax=Alienimonas californiensis TaxID=2527989 RepID=A0A517P4Q0_9PLAN|nr:hypothetical protein [Alienimonas californiensis]QDT14344.1 hypothetical protein CA12_04160 [Alienimonas californiensis]
MTPEPDAGDAEDFFVRADIDLGTLSSRIAIYLLPIPSIGWVLVSATDGYGFDLRTGWTPFTFDAWLMHRKIAILSSVAGTFVALSFGHLRWAALPWAAFVVAVPLGLL